MNHVTSREGAMDSNACVDKGWRPHTRMGKAAVNMLTKVSARALWRDHRIEVCAVDTGWVTANLPVTFADPKSNKRRVEAPLTVEDGAARVLFPIVRRLQGENAIPGKLWENYRIVPWMRTNRSHEHDKLNVKRLLFH